MSSLFQGLTKIKTLDISNFNVANCVNMTAIFEECINLESINFGSDFQSQNENKSKPLLDSMKDHLYADSANHQ